MTWHSFSVLYQAVARPHSSDVTNTAAKELAAKLAETSTTYTEGFERYASTHQGVPLRHLTGSTDRRLAEVARAVDCHKLDAVALHAVWTAKVMAAHAGLIGHLHLGGQEIAESFVARVMAERAGIL